MKKEPNTSRKAAEIIAYIAVTAFTIVYVVCGLFYSEIEKAIYREEYVGAEKLNPIEIPEEAHRVRIECGLDRYPIKVWKSTIDGPYDVAFVTYKSSEHYLTPDPFLYVDMDKAEEVYYATVSEGEPERVEITILYFQRVNRITKNTSFGRFDRVYVFYVSEEGAKNLESYKIPSVEEWHMPDAQ